MANLVVSITFLDSPFHHPDLETEDGVIFCSDY